eukprot:4849508-Alexandrium_andersonii.AAC.1
MRVDPHASAHTRARVPTRTSAVPLQTGYVYIVLCRFACVAVACDSAAPCDSERARHAAQKSRRHTDIG